MPSLRGQVTIPLIILFFFLAWTLACQSPPCARDVPSNGLDAMNGLYQLPYGMTWSGTTENPPPYYRCGYYPQFHGQPATKLPRCYFEAAINNFCQKSASSFIVESLDSDLESTAEMNTNISAVYDFSLAGNPRIWVGILASDAKFSLECKGRSTNETEGKFYQCKNLLEAILDHCA